MKIRNQCGVRAMAPSMGIAMVGLVTSLASSAALAGGASWSQVPGYRGLNNSVFPNAILLVDDFESQRPVGLTVLPENIVAGNSVDADDAAVDGSGAGGKSLFLGSWEPEFSPAFVSLSFNSKQLGGAPTRVGFVVTDSSGIGFAVPVTVTVFHEDGTSESNVIDVLSQPNDATDDLFIGFESTMGVASIAISSIIPISIDHVQYDSPLASAASFVRDDFNLDGKSDVAWFNASTRKSTLWNMDGLVRAGGGFTNADPGTGYAPRGMGDLNADRRADLIWREESTGRFTAWIMNNLSVAQQGYISGPLEAAWDIIAMGDLDGDRRADCILRHSATGEVRAWMMDGLTKRAGGFVGNSQGLRFLGVGDFNADGKDDLLWQEPGSTTVYGWLMDGFSITQQAAITNACAPGAGWRVAGVADLDGDGRSDVLWNHESLGFVSGWLMDGLNRRSGGYISTTVGGGWSIAGTPDLNGDGKRDVLWRNVLNGDVNGWIMNGLVKQSGAFIRSVPTTWSNVR